MTNLVVDFRFGGLNRRNEWGDLNGIFRDAVTQGYQSQERITPTDSGVTEGTRVSRLLREGEASDAGHLEHRGAGEIPNDDSRTDNETSIVEWMPDIWKYVDIRPVHGVNTLRDLKILDNSDSGLPSQLRPGERSSRQDEVAHEGFSVGAVRYASPLNELQGYGINGRYAVRPKRVDTLPIRPPRQLLVNGKSSIRDLGGSDCHKGVQLVPPSDQQGTHQTKKGETSYKYSWTGM